MSNTPETDKQAMQMPMKADAQSPSGWCSVVRTSFAREQEKIISRLRADNAALQDELKSVRSGSATICRELRAELDALRNRVAGYERVQEPLALRAETAEAELAVLRAKLQDAELFEAYVQRFGDYRKSFDAKIAARAALADKEQKT